MEHLIRIEHIGIAVKDLNTAEALYTKLLGEGPYKREAVESEGVMTSFFRTGPNKIELLESTRPDGPIAKAIEKRGEGIHHIAFEVADIHAEMERLRARSPGRIRRWWCTGLIRTQGGSVSRENVFRVLMR